MFYLTQVNLTVGSQLILEKIVYLWNSLDLIHRLSSSPQFCNSTSLVAKPEFTWRSNIDLLIVTVHHIVYFRIVMIAASEFLGVLESDKYVFCILFSVWRIVKHVWPQGIWMEDSKAAVIFWSFPKLWLTLAVLIWAVLVQDIYNYVYLGLTYMALSKSLFMISTFSFSFSKPKTSWDY